MAKGISEVVGEPFGAGNSRVTVYRALRQLIRAASAPRDRTVGGG